MRIADARLQPLQTPVYTNLDASGYSWPQPGNVHRVQDCIPWFRGFRGLEWPRAIDPSDASDHTRGSCTTTSSHEILSFKFWLPLKLKSTDGD